MTVSRKDRDRRYYEKNRERIKARDSTPEARAKAAQRKREHKERNPEKDRVYYLKNRESRLIAIQARCRRAKKATPPWLTKREKAQIRALYAEARALGLTVDHIHPLTHPLVCGLHVPWNLQLLTVDENLSKNNVFIPETTFHGH